MNKTEQANLGEGSPAAITATDLRRRLARNPQLRMIDVRTPAEFRAVHVTGAINKPLDRLDPQEFAAEEGELYVLCHSGKRAAIAGDRLAAAGVQGLVIVEGGAENCAEVGVHVTRGKQAMSLERQVRVAAGALVVTGVLLGWLIHPACTALSGFVGAGLVFAGVTDTCGMALMLARMPWNQGASVTPSPSGGGKACSVGGSK